MKIFKLLSISLLCATAAVVASCSDNDSIPTYAVTLSETLPADLPAGAVTVSGELNLKELNTGTTYRFALPLAPTDLIPAGTYDVDATQTIEVDGRQIALRAVASQQVISESANSLNLNWFYYNPTNTLVFGEIYFSGSLNAKGTNGLFDTYFTIYNNSDEVQYADGLAIVESKLTNTTSDEIITPANQRDANFTVQTVYVIPGNGTDVAIQPGESIKLVDQAIDWNAEVAGALNHTDADFEWYDETTNAMDTDNPDVPNLDKWFSYSKTIWIPSNQCNRSYALVRFPAGMTAEQFLANFDGTYEYITAATGKTMEGKNCYLINYEWIIDGVNLCPTEAWTQASLRADIDASYAAISEKNADKARFGRKFVRKTAGTSALGKTILKDTNDSAADFEVVNAR